MKNKRTKQVRVEAYKVALKTIKERRLRRRPISDVFKVYGISVLPLSLIYDITESEIDENYVKKVLQRLKEYHMKTCKGIGKPSIEKKEDIKKALGIIQRMGKSPKDLMQTELNLQDENTDTTENVEVVYESESKKDLLTLSNRANELAKKCQELEYCLKSTKEELKRVYNELNGMI